MKAKVKAAIEKFQNANCAQSVFVTYAKAFGMDEEVALKIASGFGGGMACAETCGAVTGAYMAIGLKLGHTSNDPEAKENTKNLVKKFNEHFVNKHGSLICKNLLGVDLSTPEGAELSKKIDFHKLYCEEYIETAITILEKELLSKDKEKKKK